MHWLVDVLNTIRRLGLPGNLIWCSLVLLHVEGSNPLNMKSICVIYGLSPYRAVNTFHLGYKNQSVYAVCGASRCLF